MIVQNENHDIMTCGGGNMKVTVGVSNRHVHLTKSETEQVEITAKYSGYINRQKDEVAKLLEHELTRIPEDFDYDKVKGLSFEVRQKLKTVKPETIGQAGRISGVTPAAISLLLIFIKSRRYLSN